MSGHREILETWFQKVWAEESTETIHELLVTDTEVKGLGAKDIIGPDEFAAFHERILALTSDVDIRIERSMESDEWIWALCSFQAQCRATGKPITMSGQVLAKVHDGKLVFGENHFDFISYFEQLGLLPENTFAQCLTGERVG